MRKKRPLDRTTKVVRDASLVVIASEDKHAVRQYFDFFRSTRIQFHVLATDEGKSAPLHVMNRLDEYMKEYEIGEGDEFWVVCDCDHWTEAGHIKNLAAVIQGCRQKGIRVALSYPCFDLWLLLHFAEFPQGNPSCEEIAGRIRDVVGTYNKTKVYGLPFDDNSVRLAVQRSANQNAAPYEIPDSPKTAVHHIIEELIKQRIVSIGQG